MHTVTLCTDADKMHTLCRTLHTAASACALNTDLLAIVRVQLRFPQAVEHEKNKIKVTGDAG